MNISNNEFLLEINKIVSASEGDIFILTSNEEEALNLTSNIKFFVDGFAVYYLPSFDSLPYDRVSPSRKILSERAYVLSKLKINNNKKILISHACNLLGKFPDPNELANGHLEIYQGQKISSKTLESFLLENAYSRTSCAMDPGEYSRRGDILDVVLFSGEAYRINFGWDNIDSIKFYDSETQLSHQKVKKIEIYQASELIINQKNIETYKANFLKIFGISKAKEPFFEKIIEGITVPGVESIAPLFYAQSFSILEYLNKPKLFFSQLAETALEEYYSEFNDFYQSRISTDKLGNFYPAAKPEYLIFDKTETLNQITEKNLIINEENKGYSFTPNFTHLAQSQKPSAAPLDLFLDYAKTHLSKKSLIIANSNYSFEKIEGLLKVNQIPYIKISHFKEAKNNLINLAQFALTRGIISPNVIIASEYEVIGERKTAHTTSKKRLKNIFKELENFNEGELVVHIEHGVGRYETIEQVVVDNIPHDCLKIIYAKGDRLFIPVENIGLLKRYGSNDIELDFLGGVGWQRRKAKLKERVGELAIKLMKLAASRKVIHIDPITIALEEYNNFCNKFPYVETEDQERAIQDIINDLLEDKPMDRLICGDVGFGKTEVAMRAAFLVAKDKNIKRQVALIVPTTILARQHYNNFMERFNGFGLKIRQLSRFVSVQEAKKVKEALSSGEIDIIVGTHALLASDVKFANLSMVIVDEEQHFGVVQKEKLKELKTNVHSLTLSATPIPRTLQMSLLGIKDLSLIATPPIDRLSVRTSLIPYDEVILRDALLRENFRGGKSFFVCPRVADLDDIYNNLKELVPELSVKKAHGQLAPSSIEDIMTEFYEGKFDVLLSTAIVESGLDIPSANTMIIYKAEMFGLSQLYQLRGRVGRGKIRGYSYLVFNKNKLPTKPAIKRLEIMQSLDSLGAGFSIASHDMDSRGFGNLVGDEQSGHIKEVGAELYQEMLEEAIASAKDEKISLSHELPNVKINVPIFIPADYIQDQSVRLSIYRRAGDISNLEEVEEFRCELADRFGSLPESVNNLLEIIYIKILCNQMDIIQLDLGPGGFNVKFSDKADANLIMNFLTRYPRHTKIKPDNKMVYIKNLEAQNYIFETKNFLASLKQ